MYALLHGNAGVFLTLFIRSMQRVKMLDNFEKMIWHPLKVVVFFRTCNVSQIDFNFSMHSYKHADARFSYIHQQKFFPELGNWLHSPFTYFVVTIYAWHACIARFVWYLCAKHSSFLCIEPPFLFFSSLICNCILMNSGKCLDVIFLNFSSHYEWWFWKNIMKAVMIAIVTVSTS